MSIKVDVNTAQIRSRFRAKSDSAGGALAMQILKDATPFVPDDGEHTLRDSGRTDKIEGTGEWAIVWDTIYAAYQWYGCWPDGSHVVKNHTTAGTHTQWVYPAMRRHKEEWDMVAQKAEERL